MSSHAVRRFSGTSDFSDVAAARRFVRSQLSEINPDVSSDLQLVVSELVTNAVEHAHAEHVTVDVTIDGNAVVLTVAHRGTLDDLPDVADWRPAPADALAGRGLGIVRRLATSVTVEQQGDQVCIVVRRALA